MWHHTADPQDTDQIKADYLTLKDLAKEICDLVETTHELEREIEHKGFPFYHYMVGLFLINQLHYLEDLLSLIPNRTAELIARTMVEGYIKLRWVEKDSENRARSWFTFSWVQEWKYAKRQESRGYDVKEQKQNILKHLDEDSRKHMNKKGITALDNGAEPDPFKHFKHDWTGLSTFQLAEKTGLINLYARYVDPISDWIHWSPKGFIKSANTSEGGTKYTFKSYYQSVASLIAGISSILGCLKIWDQVYDAGYFSKISKFEEKFNKWSPL